jgi:hypothetical protein
VLILFAALLYIFCIATSDVVGGLDNRTSQHHPSDMLPNQVFSKTWGLECWTTRGQDTTLPFLRMGRREAGKVTAWLGA